jgi:hypothetical protein
VESESGAAMERGSCSSQVQRILQEIDHQGRHEIGVRLSDETCFFEAGDYYRIQSRW